MHGVEAELMLYVQDDKDSACEAYTQADKVDERSAFFPQKMPEGDQKVIFKHTIGDQGCKMTRIIDSGSAIMVPLEKMAPGCCFTGT
jgi:hypothetical protein